MSVGTLIKTVTAAVKEFWAQQREGLDAETRTYDERERRVIAENDRWFQQELKREGAHVKGAAPEAIQNAATEIRRQRAAARTKYFKSMDADICVARETRVREISAHILALQSDLPALVEFDKQYRAMALECGEWRPFPHDCDALLHACAEFLDRETRRSAAPVKRPVYMKPETNPITVPE